MQRVPPEPSHRPPECTCRWKVKGLGILYGISLGRDWVRIDDDPDCPVHGNLPAEALSRLAEDLDAPADGGGPVPRLEGDIIVKSWRYKGP